MRRRFAFLFLTFALAAGAPSADADRLFDSDEVLELALVVPLRTLLRKAKVKPILDGNLQYTDAAGNAVAIDARVTTRGNSRLEYCSFPPLLVSLNPAQVDGTLFAGQQKLKIVTHCRKGSTYERYLRQEFGLYMAYNVLSDRSFRVRMLNMTYRDSEQRRRDETAPAFFIESEDEVAGRLGMEEIKVDSIRPRQLNASETSVLELFQYMIANTDWGLRTGSGTEPCCHNARVFGKPDTDRDWVALPYDFDQAGIIDAEYALPASGLRIRSVRQRLYRGQCLRNAELPDSIDLFNERRDGIEAAIAPDSQDKRTRNAALRYLAVFFEIINDPEKLTREILSACRGGGKR